MKRDEQGRFATRQAAPPRNTKASTKESAYLGRGKVDALDAQSAIDQCNTEDAIELGMEQGAGPEVDLDNPAESEL